MSDQTFDLYIISKGGLGGFACEYQFLRVEVIHNGRRRDVLRRGMMTAIIVSTSTRSSLPYLYQRDN